MSNGAYSLKLTTNNSFLEKLFMAKVFTLKVFSLFYRHETIYAVKENKKLTLYTNLTYQN